MPRQCRGCASRLPRLESSSTRITTVSSLLSTPWPPSFTLSENPVSVRPPRFLRKNPKPTRGSVRNAAADARNTPSERMPVPTKNRPPTIRLLSRIRRTSTRSDARSAACLTSRLSSISRRRWNSVSAQVAAVTKPRKHTPYVRSAFDTEPATSSRNASWYICCQSRAARRVYAFAIVSQTRNCAPTPRKSPVTTAVRIEYASANTDMVVQIHDHRSYLIRGGSQNHEAINARKPASAIGRAELRRQRADSQRPLRVVRNNGASLAQTLTRIAYAYAYAYAYVSTHPSPYACSAGHSRRR